MRQIWRIAQKEVSDGLRNRWLLAITMTFAILAIGIAWFGSAASGQIGFSSVETTIASLTSLASFLIPLIALLVAYDAIVGEDEGGTLLLLLTYPLSRMHLLIGKFCGHSIILGLAAVTGFGSAALAIVIFAEGVVVSEVLAAFGRFILSSTLLGWSFLALAYLVSALVTEKKRAAGLALSCWFLFVLVFDLALLAILTSTEGRMSPETLPWLLMLNPTDIYRLINLTAMNGFGGVSGALAIGADLPLTHGLWLGLAVWVAAPLLLAHIAFTRRAI
ncbi:ABC-type transport system involved in multi-copper enzyme maturation, permease component [Hahella chejuensis KCTC 2396]|uniref:ABC-type transport system involved in multi-copper enzyme maturation, permease component n=1 Tax=Hahella chejuensis (strain KCTC 2396) TaxID=349521 RepID=Q2SGT9_HAHCH|nr:ABC transporter permease subunit [Hahella chejuensis]ABC30135.1 ABC-type transport system involved in multi-copper enzyme maturation, permease component [Hahella chejuensis KCTC 2396]